MEFRNDKPLETRELFNSARKVVDGRIALQQGKLRENAALIIAALQIANRDKKSDLRAGKKYVPDFTDEPDVVGNYSSLEFGVFNILSRGQDAEKTRIGHAKFRK